MKKRRRGLSLSAKRSLHGYLFILPFLLGFIFLILSPLLLYVVMGFNKISAGSSGITLNYVGWKNFSDVLFSETDFFQDTATSIGNLFLTGTCIVIFSFFISTILNQKFKGRGVARAIFFLPVVVASGSAALSQNDALSNSAISAITGMTAQAGNVSQLNLVDILMNLLGSSGSSVIQLVVTLITEFYIIVMSSGVQILIFLAGLQTISPSLYEAAYMDGATAWESFWKITLPMISPLILVNSVYTIVDFMSSPNNNIINKMYQYSIEGSKFGLSSAMGTIYFGIVFLILGIVFLVMSRFIVYEDR